MNHNYSTHPSPPRGDHKWSVNYYILITHVLQVSGLMFEPREKGGQDSWSFNSSLIDFNGEILISVWPRSASMGQSHLLGNAGHPVCWSQSIILALSTEKGKRGETNLRRAPWNSNTISVGSASWIYDKIRYSFCTQKKEKTKEMI